MGGRPELCPAAGSWCWDPGPFAPAAPDSTRNVLSFADLRYPAQPWLAAGMAARAAAAPGFPNPGVGNTRASAGSGHRGQSTGTGFLLGGNEPGLRSWRCRTWRRCRMQPQRGDQVGTAGASRLCCAAASGPDPSSPVPPVPAFPSSSCLQPPPALEKPPLAALAAGLDPAQGQGAMVPGSARTGCRHRRMPICAGHVGARGQGLGPHPVPPSRGWPRGSRTLRDSGEPGQGPHSWAHGWRWHPLRRWPPAPAYSQGKRESAEPGVWQSCPC